ncbi:endonuclease III [bacterium]|nr:MAG: endonuclease III [bacterium]
MRNKKSEAARLEKILALLKGPEEEPKPGLVFGSPWELLVSTILSAQCTDKRVNATTPALFARFPGPEELASAKVAEVEEIIRSIGLFRNKARNIVEAAKAVVRDHKGEVPSAREELEALPGVGRKTASVVLSQGFNVPAFAVDTHVGRVCYRLGFSRSKAPPEVEKSVTALLPEEKWRSAHLILIRHGRAICTARTPKCPVCPVLELCPRVGLGKLL